MKMSYMISIVAEPNPDCTATQCNNLVSGLNAQSAAAVGELCTMVSFVAKSNSVLESLKRAVNVTIDYISIVFSVFKSR
mgnify:CR=1 FL=1